MLFNSPEYLLLFLVALVLGWTTVRWPRVRIILLTLISFYFYAANNRWLLVLLLVSTQIDYLAARAIEGSPDPRRRKALLAVSLTANLGLLGLFKYFNFLVGSATDAARAFGFEAAFVPWSIVLPVGISFYTFQSMSYTIDVYRGQLRALRSWWDFAFFVAFFPQLVAGPIVRASDFIPQIPRPPGLTDPELRRALWVIARGLVKKIVLADFLAGVADPVFDGPLGVGTARAWIGLYAFTFQIYFDFSGYSDIAIGCARLLGYRLPENFALPYAAASFSDFWRRWHISLSSWLRDYLYIPLGGNRTTAAGVYRNLMLTMLLGGLWHGAAWHFVLWGLCHGLYLAVERRLGLTTKEGLEPRWCLLRRLVVFHAVVFTWLLFRAQDTARLADLCRVLSGAAGVVEPLARAHVAALALCAAAWVTQQVAARRDLDGAFLRLPVPVQGCAYAAVMAVLLVFNSRGAQPFIYFAF